MTEILHESSAGLVVRADDGTWQDGETIVLRRWQPLTRMVCFEREMRVRKLSTRSRGGQYHLTHGAGHGECDLPAEWGDTDYELVPAGPQTEGETGRHAFEVGKPRYY